MNCKGPFQKCKFNLFHILFLDFYSKTSHWLILQYAVCVWTFEKWIYGELVFRLWTIKVFCSAPLKGEERKKIEFQSFKVSNVNSMFEILFCSDWWPICRSLGEKRSRRRWSLCQKSPRWRPRWTITQIQNLWVFPVNCDGKAVFIVFTGSVQLPAPNASDWGSQWHDGGISIHLSSHLLLMVKKTPTISKVDPQRQWRQTP